MKESFPEKKSFFSSFRAMAALCLIALLLVFLVSALVLSRPNPDEGIHTTTAWLMLQGYVPFKDIFSMYAPGSYFILAAFYLVFPLDFVLSRFFMLAVGLAALLAFFALCKKLMNEKAALFASLLFVVMSVFTINWNIVMEPFLAFFSILSFYFIFSFLERGSRKHLALAGVFLASLVIMKQTMLFLSLASLLALFFAARPNRREASLLILSYALLPLLLLLYLFSHNAFFDFVGQAILYNLSHSSLFAFSFHLSWFLVTGLFLSIPVIGFALFLLKKISLDRTKAAFLFLWFVFSLPNLVPVLGCCGHHLPLVPVFAIFFAILFGYAFFKVSELRLQTPKLMPVLKCFLVLALTASLFGAGFYLSQFLFQNDFKDLFEISEYVKANSSPDDTIFVTYWDEEVYFLSLRKPATSYLYAPFLFPEEVEAHEADMIAQFEKNKPLFVVNFSRTDRPLESESGINQYLRTNYHVVKELELSKPLYNTFNYGFVLRRNGS